MSAVSPILTKCPSCRSSFRVSETQLGKRAKCTSCGKAFVVALCKSKGSGSANSNSAVADTAPKLVAVLCPTCGTRLDGSNAKPGQMDEVGRMDKVEQRTSCPDCGLTSQVELSKEEPLTERSLLPEEEEYQLDEDDLISSLSATSPSIYTPLYEATGQQDEEEREKQIQRAATDRSARPRMPSWPLLSGYKPYVFGPGVLSRWVTISLAFTASGSLAAFTWPLIFQGYGAIVALPFLCLAASIAACAYAVGAACAVLVVTESSEGNDLIQPWPGSNPADWMGEALHLFFALSVACIPGWGIAKLLGAQDSEVALAMAVSGWLLFPFALLSMLEGGSILSFVSPGVFGSLFHRPGSWITCWLLSGTGAAFVVGGVLLLAIPQSLFLLLLAAPLGIAALGLYARLIGRLAWRIRE